ncbi:MAG: iron-containing redox enzyme family protein [Symploca sp. SIO3C6]|nr:iron-containing redox enzyme family protein [Symploca sp. SIO3C6]
MKIITNSQKLRVMMKLMFPSMTDAITALEENQQISIIYQEYLFILHSFVRASVPLMNKAYQQLQQDTSKQDPMYSLLLNYLEHHIEEENNHDLWILEDLEILGINRQELLNRVPNYKVAEIVGMQYYWIYHFHPAVLLGYIAVMEGQPPSMKMIERMIAKTGYPREAFRTLIYHSQVDAEHQKDLDTLLDDMNLSSDLLSAVIKNALHTFSVSIDILRGLTEQSVTRIY